MAVGDVLCKIQKSHLKIIEITESTTKPEVVKALEKEAGTDWGITFDLSVYVWMHMYHSLEIYQSIEIHQYIEIDGYIERNCDIKTC